MIPTADQVRGGPPDTKASVLRHWLKAWLSGPQGRKRLIGSGAAVLLILALTINERSPRRVSTPTDVAAAKELVGVLDKGQSGTYHARYRSTSPDGAADFELWRRPPNPRQRVQTEVDGVREVTEVIVTATDVISCMQSGDGPWSCSSSPELRGSLDALGPVPEGALDGERVAKRRTTIAGEPAGCFTVEVPAEGASDVCVTTDGIPLLLTSGGSQTELLSLERTVEDDAFEPPAPPTPGETVPASGALDVGPAGSDR